MAAYAETAVEDWASQARRISPRNPEADCATAAPSWLITQPAPRRRVGSAARLVHCVVSYTVLCRGGRERTIKERVKCDPACSRSRLLQALLAPLFTSILSSSRLGWLSMPAPWSENGCQAIGADSFCFLCLRSSPHCWLSENLRKRAMCAGSSAGPSFSRTGPTATMLSCL